MNISGLDIFPNANIVYRERNWQTSGWKMYHLSGRFSFYISNIIGKNKFYGITLILLTPAEIHHVNDLELLHLERNPSVGVQPFVYSWALSSNQYQKRRLAWGFSFQHLGPNYPVKNFPRNPLSPDYRCQSYLKILTLKKVLKKGRNFVWYTSVAKRIKLIQAK